MSMNFEIDYEFLGLSQVEKIKGLANFKVESDLKKPEIFFEAKEHIKDKINVISYVASRKSKSKLF